MPVPRLMPDTGKMPIPLNLSRAGILPAWVLYRQDARSTPDARYRQDAYSTQYQ
ncbi:MAG: hypothetical protein F6J94_15065 [Moorea sp. SIO1F2]|uniref:hypothetical protein n=1 Tax=Moorena sp. SIO1F2 TaxID=2607819 RepID=UPI0013B870D6|nr:hypothetical protein [Moorena sp. SIO1F2]NET83197.1 hypothetical protein [Moorena sp. SIO1F2]